MKRKNVTRNALFTSILSLLLCVSMLVGTTFAWFTDEVVSGTNVIAAGNLDVEVYYGNPDDKNSIQDVDTLFNDVILWEPGAVAWENLTVVNEGNLALKYDLMINFTNENTVDGNGLSTALQVGVVEGGVQGNTREAVVAEVGEWTSLLDFVKRGYLMEQNAFKTYGIVIRWLPSEKDNNWNVQNGKATSDGEPLHIDLGINLIANQVTYEYDSFGNDYDTMADGEYHLLYTFDHQEDLLSFAPEKGNAASSGLKAVGGEAQINTSGAWFEMDADLTKTQVTIGYDLDITGMTAGEYITVDLGEQETWGGSPMAFVRGSAIVHGGLTPADTNKLDVLEGTALRVVHTFGAGDKGIVITTVVTDGDESITYTVELPSADPDNKLYWDIYTATEEDMATMDNFSVRVTTLSDSWDGTADFGMFGLNAAWLDEDGNLTSDFKAEEYEPSDVLIIRTAEELAAFQKLVNAGEFFEGKTVMLANDINLGLTDTDGNPVLFTPIGDGNNTGFLGTFDGDGHTIYNLRQDCNATYVGFFGCVENATIKNITFDNALVENDGRGYAAIVASCGKASTFENITLKNCNLRNYNHNTAGIIGWLYGSENSTFDRINIDATNTISSWWGSYDTRVGGIVGAMNTTATNTVTIKNSTVACRLDVYNDVCSNYQWYNYRMAGMLVADVRDNVTVDGRTQANPVRVNCENVTVIFGDWANYHYCEDADYGTPSYAGEGEYKFNRVEAGAGYGGIDLSACDHDANEQHNVLIEFDFLFGARDGKGVYGVSSHDGVTVVK